MNAVVAALRRAGVAAADLQTTQASLEQRQSGDGQPTTGFTASGTVLAQLRDLGRAAAVVDAAVGAGATSFYGPSLASADTGKLYAQALVAAVADARAKAKTLADTSGLTLGRITSVVEGGGSTVVPYAAGCEGRLARDRAGDAGRAGDGDGVVRDDVSGHAALAGRSSSSRSRGACRSA